MKEAELKQHTWTEDDDAKIVRMKVGGSPCSDIALAMSKGHKIINVRIWRRRNQTH